jgi:translation initiation factor 1
MPNSPSYDENLVYSTDNGRVEKQKPQLAAGKAYADGFVRIKRETKGRKGKGVTTINGIEGDNDQLKKIAATLKKRCSTGGSIKSGVIEIQGDQRDVVKAELEKLGYKVKFAGG